MKSLYYMRLKIILICFSFILIGISTFFFIETASTGTAYADSTIGMGTHFEVEKNPIETVYISAEKLEVMRSEHITLSTEIYPENGGLTVNDTSFFIINGNGFAQIDGNCIIINDSAPIGSRIVVMAEVDGVESCNAISLIVKKTPVDGIEFLTTDTEIVSGSSYLLETNILPANATEKGVRYSVENGAKYVNVSYNGVLMFNNIAQPDENYSIEIKATSVDNPAIYTIKKFNVTPPAFDTILANKELTGVEQQRTYSFCANNEPFVLLFGNKAVYYSIDVDSNIATIDLRGLLYIKPDAPIGTHIVVSLDANDGTHYSQELEVISVFASSFSPVLLSTPTAKWNGNNYYLPGDTLRFDVAAFYPSNVTSFNKEFDLLISDSSLAAIDGDKVIIKDKISKTNPHLTVTVVSEPNGLEQSFEIDIYIELSAIKLVSNVTELQENNAYAIDSILEGAISPENAMHQPIEYFIESESSDFAYLRNNNIYIRDDLPAGNINVGLYAVAGGVRSGTVWYNIYKPVKTLNLEADNYEPISSLNKGDTVTLFTKVNENASINNPSYRVETGANFINDNIQYVEMLPDGRAKWQFTIKNQLALVDKVAPIVLYAEQDGVCSNKIVLDIHIPDEALAVKETNVNRGSTHKISFTHTQNATVKSVEWLVATTGISKVEKSTDEFYVPQNLSAGSKIVIKYRSGDKKYFGINGAWKTATFTVARLSATDRPDSHNVYDNGNLYSGFNTVFGKDIGGQINYVIGKNGSTPQLWHGRSTLINLVYSNSSISDYGMLIEAITVSGAAVEQPNTRTNDSFVIKANESAKVNDEIVVSIKVSDGNAVYTLPNVKLYAFRELSGSLEFNTITKTGVNITNFVNRNKSSFDFTANDGMGALEFAVLNPNGFKINNGIINATSYTANKEQQIKYSFTQTYNGTLLATYSKNATVILRTVNLDNTLGDGRSYYTALQGMYPSRSSVGSLPYLSGLNFDGYGDYIDGNGKIIKDLGNCSNTLSAKWKPKTYTYTATDNHTITDDCDKYMFKDTIDPGFNISALKELGYTKIKITIVYDCHEIDDGYQDIFIFSGSDSNQLGKTSRDDEGSSWHTITLNFNVSIDKFKTNNASFYIGWGASGGLSDDWKLGTRTVTVQAV